MTGDDVEYYKDWGCDAGRSAGQREHFCGLSWVLDCVLPKVAVTLR